MTSRAGKIMKLSLENITTEATGHRNLTSVEAPPLPIKSPEVVSVTMPPKPENSIQDDDVKNLSGMEVNEAETDIRPVLEPTDDAPASSPDGSSATPMDTSKYEAQVMRPPSGSISSSSSSYCSRSNCSYSSSSSSEDCDDAINDRMYVPEPASDDYSNEDEEAELDDRTAYKAANVVAICAPNAKDQELPILGSPLKKGKKRKRNPDAWRRNAEKKLRNSGQSYHFVSHANGVTKQKTREARAVKPACGDKCKLQCSSKITEEERKKLLTEFWAVSDVERQRQFIANSMQVVQPQIRVMRVGGKRPPRRNNNAFYFRQGDQLVRVCKLFFKNTLDITDRTIRTVVEKMDNVTRVVMDKDKRGKHGKQKKLDPQIKEGVRQFIESIPKIESHYTRANSSRLYIDGSKSIAELHKDYVKECETANTPSANYVMFYRLFTEDFNISFFTPKKDQCATCVIYENANESERLTLQHDYDKHHAEKKLSREEKKADKENPNAIVAVYDLQAVVQLPKGEVSLFYYSSKLNVLNFTIFDMTNDNCHCYVWDESNGHRGVNELGTCVLRYLKGIAEAKEAAQVIFYSDNCAGQQKNKYMLALYMHAVQSLNLKSITHKFLIKGHTQNEGDSAHSLIERQMKKTLKSGPMYTTESFVSVVKAAKKSKNPFSVNLLCHEDFYDIKSVAEHYGPFVMKDVNLSEARVVRVEKESPGCLFVKHNYSEKEFKVVSIVKGKKGKPKAARNQDQNSCAHFTPKFAFKTKPGIPEKKKTDLLNLVKKNIIPAAYKSFYNNL